MTAIHSNAAIRLRRTFNRRYAIALTLLAVAACISFGLSYRMSLMDANRSQALNLVHAQRTDSQRIAFLIKSLDATNSVAATSALRDELRTTVDRMRNNHETLIGQSTLSKPIMRFIAPLHSIYFEGADPFDSRIVRFLESAAVIARIEPGTGEWGDAAHARSEVVKSATDTMLQTHGLMTLILEAEAKRSNDLEKAYSLAAWIATLALIAGISLIIFRPLVRHVLASFQEMEVAKQSAEKAEETAKVANDAKGYFFQAASHELKTPLNAILGMSDAIRDKGDLGIDDELNEVIAASDHLLTLLNNILDTHRLADGPLNLDHREFTLLDVVNRPLARTAALAESKGIDFRSNIDIKDDLAVLGDSQRLEQVIFNLVDNAVKFTESGEIAVDARLLTATAGLTLALAVRDTGVGISGEKLDKLFDPMAEQGSMLSRSGGLGVGLSIVRAIVSSMGGSVDVRSAVGEGTTVTLSLPLEPADPEVLKDPVAVRSERAVTQAGDDLDPAEQAPAGLNILIVDDNMANRMVAEALVKPLGARTTMAADGRQAVDRAAEEPFDLIFMDISMPVMDGVKATQLIRESDGPNADTPVVALTAHVGPGEWSGLGQVGFNDILNKPVRKDVIQKCVEKWVRRPQAAEKAA